MLGIAATAASIAPVTAANDPPQSTGVTNVDAGDGTDVTSTDASQSAANNAFFSPWMVLGIGALVLFLFWDDLFGKPKPSAPKKSKQNKAHVDIAFDE